MLVALGSNRFVWSDIAMGLVSTWPNRRWNVLNNKKLYQFLSHQISDWHT